MSYLTAHPAFDQNSVDYNKTRYEIHLLSPNNRKQEEHRPSKLYRLKPCKG